MSCELSCFGRWNAPMICAMSVPFGVGLADCWPHPLPIISAVQHGADSGRL